MITQDEIKVYQLMRSRMDSGEYLLGISEYTFECNVLEYTATCIEAVPINALEQVICQLLLIEESLSFEEIGDILGLSVCDDSQSSRVMDPAEKELLTSTLRSLATDGTEGMIITGDYYMSECSLTDTGKEYAARNTKFRITADRQFRIFTDETTGLNAAAKVNYESLLGEGIFTGSSYIRPDPEVLKNLASSQASEVYNPEVGNSFIDEQITTDNSYEINLPVAETINPENGLIKRYCFTNSRMSQINNELTTWLNDKARETDSLWSDDELFAEAQLPSGNFKEPIDLLLSPKFASTDAKAQIFIALPATDPVVLRKILAAYNNIVHPNSRVFILLHCDDEKEEDVLNKLLGEFSKSKNCYGMTSQLAVEHLSVTTEKNRWYYKTELIRAGNSEKKVFVERPSDSWSDEMDDVIRQEFYRCFADNLKADLKQLLERVSMGKSSKAAIKKLSDLRFKIDVFAAEDPSDDIQSLINVTDVYLRSKASAEKKLKSQKRSGKK